MEASKRSDSACMQANRIDEHVLTCRFIRIDDKRTTGDGGKDSVQEMSHHILTRRQPNRATREKKKSDKNNIEYIVAIYYSEWQSQTNRNENTELPIASNEWFLISWAFFVRFARRRSTKLTTKIYIIWFSLFSVVGECRIRLQAKCEEGKSRKSKKKKMWIERKR